MFYDKYVYLCNKKGETPSGAALNIGLSKPTVNRWKNGGGATDATIQRVAEYFDVSIDFFCDDEDKITPSIQENEGLLDADLVKDLLQLTPAESEMVRAFVKVVLERREV